MPLSLYVDGDRWRSTLRAVAKAHPGLVPVAKGNGYGFGLGRLARRAKWLGSDLLAVGTYTEIASVQKRFPGDLLVLSPWRPGLPDPSDDRRVVHTVSRLADLAALAAKADRPRVVLEGLTSMHRHGMGPEEFAAAAGRLADVRLEGIALHLPLPNVEQHVAEVDGWLERMRLAQLATRSVYVSHLSSPELAELGRRHRDVAFRPRVGTGLWLGARQALAPRATVLDSHAVRRGERIGYRQRRMPRAGTVLVVAGGTAHGVGLESPAAGTSARQRAVALARGGLDAAGFALSPYTVDGRQRWFVEPPHMQVSLIFLPADAASPAVGDEIAIDVRFTATTFDRVVIT